MEGGIKEEEERNGRKRNGVHKREGFRVEEWIIIKKKRVKGGRRTEEETGKK